MDFGELQDRLGFLLNFNDGEADQDFSLSRLKQALNFVYAEEVNKAKQEGSKRYFREYTDKTWPASAVTFELPSDIDSKELISITDITDSDPGQRLTFTWRDRRTLQWGTTGPASDRTLRFFYYAQPVDMSDDQDTPDLIPTAYQELLVWAAAVRLRIVGDEKAPAEWTKMRDELRADFWKSISRGRPTDDIPRIQQIGEDLGGDDDPLDVPPQDGRSINSDNNT